MAKKDKSAGKLTLGMKCGECLHFKTGPKSPLYKGKCSDLGVKPFGKACQGFTPNFTLLNRKESGLNASMRIAKLARKMTPAQRKVLGYLLTKVTNSFDKAGVYMGEPMYLYLEPTIGLGRTALEKLKDVNFNYLDNYYLAYVVGITDLGDGYKEIYLASSQEGKPDYYVSVNIKGGERMSRALTEEQFEKVKEKLIEEGKKKMPSSLRKRLERFHKETLMQPKSESQMTIDDVPSSWWDYGVSEDEKKYKRNKGISLSRARRNKFKSQALERELEMNKVTKRADRVKKKGRMKIKLIS